MAEPVKEVLALIEKIIEEHKLIFKGLQALEKIANDAGAMRGLDAAKDMFMPGRFEQAEGLQKLQETVDKVEEGLKAHFGREETSLKSAVEKYGGETLVSTLSSLLLEHEDIRSRFIHSKKHISDLKAGGLSRHVWEASAHDMRAHLTHTRNLMLAHAEIEQELLHTLRNELTQGKEGKGRS